jgi:CubicO group peptidase (beta-lactamase class C family)
MRRSLAAIIVAISSLTAAHAAPNDLLYARFERFLEALRAQAGIPGMVAIVVGESDIVWERTFGYQNQERSLGMLADTPFHLDGLTQVVTATLVLRCADRGLIDLDDPIGNFESASAEPGSTIRHILSHTRPTLAGGAVYEYDPQRYDALQKVVRECTGDSYRENVASLFGELAMNDSVPGIDAPLVTPPDEGVPTLEASQRYQSVLERLTTSYTVQGRRTVASVHVGTTLTPSGGIVTTARDLAKLDVALKQGLLSPELLTAAWTVPPSTPQAPLPHGLGWFAQVVDGEPIVWQYGASPVSSSFMMSLPNRRLTMILLANSNGLVEPFVLTPGDVTASPFARVFLGLVSP